MLDLDQFENTAAWLEFCEGMTRFQAETEAARRQGVERWQAMQEVNDENRKRNSECGGNNRQAMARGQHQNDLPAVQPAPQEKARAMSERHAQAGWSGVALLALFVQWGGLV